ncbi:MAG: glycosyltransferase [Aeromicrobium sp.]|uniref:glycosyltransferase n=1 Tax=Aeromicrobium sp. TaxID=1871063 RepID=UPI00260659AB|nr:glycosyltransferase [Aeromicrobium sp.]MDF1706230.1 glycosyltransferase [Aeromicrobium sp.]
MQAHLYPRLSERGWELAESSPRDRGRGLLSRLVGLISGFIPASGSTYLSVIPPLPVFIRKRHVVSVIHDLRWLRTRGRLARAYRSWDLRRTIAHSKVLVCISQRTQADLLAFDTRSAKKTVVALEGPGLVNDGNFNDVKNGQVLLIGGAEHKRNELAARALALAKPEWCRSIVGVGVSQECRDVLTEHFGAFETQWHERISDLELELLYRNAEVFLFLGVEEGFGLPYIEALSSGCKVVAIEQQLTVELLGDAGILIRDGDASEIASQLIHIEDPGPSIRANVASRYSWDAFADAIDASLRSRSE